MLIVLIVFVFNFSFCFILLIRMLFFVCGIIINMLFVDHVCECGVICIWICFMFDL